MGVRREENPFVFGERFERPSSRSTHRTSLTATSTSTSFWTRFLPSGFENA
jgi:hypothetical protein